MKAGDHARCPHCGENTFVKENVVMDGWTVKGKILTCAMCGKKLADAPGTTTAADADDGKAKAKLSALAGLFGEDPVEKPKLDMTGIERKFCKDCRSFIVHPFLTRCGKFDRDVDPMGDCPEYQPRDQDPKKE